MGRKGTEYGDYRQYLAGETYTKLKETTDLLDSEDTRVLMIWDGFDKPLGQGRLSAHLWDQMREVFNLHFRGSPLPLLASIDLGENAALHDVMGFSTPAYHQESHGWPSVNPNPSVRKPDTRSNRSLNTINASDSNTGTSNARRRRRPKCH
jgi:hypothetical protein